MLNTCFKKTLVSVVLCLSPLLAYAEIVVIANKDLPLTTLSKQEIRRIYFGKMKLLPNGSRVTPIDQCVGSPSRDKFYIALANKTCSEIKCYRARELFAGRAYPPAQETDDKSVIEAVSKNCSFVGYIDKSSLDDSVKVVCSLG